MKINYGDKLIIYLNNNYLKNYLQFFVNYFIFKFLNNWNY